MNQNNLLELVQKNGISCLAIIGLAKNAGKTVALNTLIREAARAGLKLAVASYGRDGEKTDIITLKKKPPIFIPPGTYFVTAEKLFEKSRLQAKIIADTGYNTVLGRVRIYRNDDRKKGIAKYIKPAGEIELAGVNRVSRMLHIQKLLPGDVDLFLLDGALDRRSSAIPTLAQGIILATGAVVGNSIDLIVQHTMDEVKRITLPQCNDRVVKLRAGEILKNGKSGLIRNGEISNITFNSFGILLEADSYPVETGDFLVINGALTNSFAESLLLKSGVENYTIIVRDGTRVFLNNRNINSLKKKSISLCVHESINLIALTVNPYSPYGFRVDSDLLLESLSGSLRETGIEIPVFDVLSKNYL